MSGFSHVAIPCTDVAEARRFYVERLGFTELPRPDLGVPGLWLGVGALQLHLLEVPEVDPPGKGFPHFALRVPAEAFDETYQTLRDAGIAFLGEPSTRVDFGTEVRAAFMKDPSGNFIELTTA